jgi:spore maturation protein CgeB
MNDRRLPVVGGPSATGEPETGAPSSSDRLLAKNLEGLTSLSPCTADLVRRAAPGDGVATVIAQSGDPVLVAGGRALDSRRDPVSAAERVAADSRAAAVVVLGLGGGYLAEALMRRGISVTAVVEHSAIIGAALRARDLGRLLASCPIVAVESLVDRTGLARLRAHSHAVVVHAPSVAQTPELGALAERWNRLPAARAPRVLVVGPLSGGSLGIARHVAGAARALGADTRFFDASPFGAAQRQFGALPITADGRTYLQGRLTLLVGEAVVGVAGEWRPDLVLALAQAPLTEPALSALNEGGAATAFWFVENVRVLPYWRDVVRHYGHVYAIQPGPVLEQMREAGAASVSYLPMACDPEVHLPVALATAEAAEYESPVSFAGAPYLNRRHLLGIVADLGLKVWGEGWEHTPLAARLGRPGRFDLDAMLRVFAGTSVNLNVHSADHVTGLDPEPDYVNPRTFELAAAGAFQLVDWRAPLSALFTGDEMATFRTPSEMRGLAEHYLAAPRERDAMAAAARRRALSEHTYRHRVERVLRDTLPAHLLPGVAPEAAPSLDAAASASAAAPILTVDEALLRMLVDIRDSAAAK